MIIQQKKGVELSLQTVVVLIIVIIVIIVMISFFSEHFTSNSDAITDTGKNILNGSLS